LGIKDLGVVHVYPVDDAFELKLPWVTVTLAVIGMAVLTSTLGTVAEVAVPSADTVPRRFVLANISTV
jgi:hypothetical protein